MGAVAVLDFETTGLSPDMGDRATEIAITLLRDGAIVDRYQSLMNAGRRIPADVVQLTGITNEMIAAAPTAAKVMAEAARFVGKAPLVAHNASFDRKFWCAELARLALPATHDFACTMLLARRVYPMLDNHRLSNVVQRLGLPMSGKAHRAMVDAEMASHLWCRIQSDLQRGYGLKAVSHQLLAQLQRVPKANVPAYLRSLAGK